MEHYRLIPQEKNNYCVCSVLQGIFRDNGLQISQKEIAKNLTPAKNGFKTDDQKMKDFMKSKGFDYSFYWHNETPFNERDYLIGEISNNNGFVGLGIHTYRILEFKDPKIIVDDPKNSEIKVFGLSNLINDFENIDGGFGLIKKLD